jgi:hypothetical protein
MGVSIKRFNDIQAISVPTDTLDNLFNAKNVPVHFIKIDTEGWEYNILRGGEQTLRAYKPVLQLEYNVTNMAQCNVDPAVLGSYLRHLSYSVTHRSGEEIICEHVRD